MARAGARYRMNFRGFSWGLDDGDAELVNPGWDVTRTRDPLDVGLSRKRCEQRPPIGDISVRPWIAIRPKSTRA